MRSTVLLRPAAFLAALTVTLALARAVPARAAEVVLPTVAVDVLGRPTGMEIPTPVHFSTEVRVTNLSGAPKRFAVVDWIGSCGFVPREHTVAPGATLSLGGWSLFGLAPDEPLPACVTGPVYGVAVAEADQSLLVQTALLASPLETRPTPAVIHLCKSWEGGLNHAGLPFCNPGAGPVVDNGGGFFPANATLHLPWLHTDEGRRTNLVLVNPDDAAAEATLVVTSADGKLSVPYTLTLAARAYVQLNDLFSQFPWSAVRDHNRGLDSAAARATVRSAGRLYAVAYVHSNYDGGTSVVLPRRLD